MLNVFLIPDVQLGAVVQMPESGSKYPVEHVTGVIYVSCLYGQDSAPVPHADELGYRVRLFSR
jgi:hypothetical protein